MDAGGETVYAGPDHRPDRADRRQRREGAVRAAGVLRLGAGGRSEERCALRRHRPAREDLSHHAGRQAERFLRHETGSRPVPGRRARRRPVRRDGQDGPGLSHRRPRQGLRAVPGRPVGSADAGPGRRCALRRHQRHEAAGRLDGQPGRRQCDGEADPRTSTAAGGGAAKEKAKRR